MVVLKQSGDNWIGKLLAEDFCVFLYREFRRFNSSRKLWELLNEVYIFLSTQTFLNIDTLPAAPICQTPITIMYF
jgi:hypothetical protein